MFNPHYNRYLMYGERYPTPAEPAQPSYGVDGLYPMPGAQAAQGADGLYPMPGAQAAQGADGPYPMPLDRPVMGQAYVPLGLEGIPPSPSGPLPTLANLDQELADATYSPEPMAQSPEHINLQLMQLYSDMANRRDVLPRTGGGVGLGWSEMSDRQRAEHMAQSATPGKAPARRRPASKMQKKVMAMFGGDMGAYNQWHASLSDANRKKVTNWSKAFKHLNDNPRSAPGAAPSGDFAGPPLHLAGSGPGPSAVEAPVGSVSSVGEGAVVPRAEPGVPAPAQVPEAREPPSELFRHPMAMGGAPTAPGKSPLESYARAMAPGIFGYPEDYVSPGGQAPGVVASTGPTMSYERTSGYGAPSMVASTGPTMSYEPMTGYGAPAPAPEYGYGAPPMSMEIPQAPQPGGMDAPRAPQPGRMDVPKVTLADIPPHLRHLMPRAPAPAVERPMGYFDEAFDFGLEAGLPMDEARSAAFGMARERDPDYWGSYDLGGGGAAPPPGAVASTGPTMSYEPTALGPFAPVPEPEADYWGGPSVREVADPYGYGARAEYILGGGATGPAASGPAFNMAANLEQGLARDDPRSPEDQLRNPMPPGVNYRYSMAGNLLPEPRGVAGPAFDMAANLGEGPYDMSADLLPPGEDASMMQQLAHRKRIRQGAARARTGRRAREEQAQAEYIAQLVEPYSHMANQRAEAKRRQEEALMGMAQRLQDTGTLHAPGPSAGRYTAGYQPLPQLPSPMHMAEDPMRLPAMDLNEYRRQVMMEMLLNQSNRPVAYDPALLDTLGQ